jgi:hypothetical protein
MSVDIWNVCFYGGLEAEATLHNTPNSYVSKTILALNDDIFQCLRQSQRSTLDFIDPN